MKKLMRIKKFNQTKPKQCNRRPCSYFLCHTYFNTSGTLNSSHMLEESTAAHVIFDTTENMEGLLHGIIDKLRIQQTCYCLPEQKCQNKWLFKKSTYVSAKMEKKIWYNITLSTLGHSLSKYLQTILSCCISEEYQHISKKTMKYHRQ